MTTGFRASLLAGLAVGLSGLLLTFVPVTTTRPAGGVPQSTAGPTHHEEVRISCGSVMLPHPRREQPCPGERRRQGTFAQAVAIAATPVFFASWLLFGRASGRPRDVGRRAVFLAGIVTFVAAVVLLFRPLHAQVYDDSIKTSFAVSTLSTHTYSCGSVAIYRYRRDPECRRVTFANGVFAATVAGAGVVFALAGAVLLAPRSRS